MSSTQKIALPISIMGVPFDPVTTDGAILRIEEMIASRKPHYLVTANVDFLVQARQDVELRRILMEAHLVLCDGTPLVWASHLLGNPLPERVAGADLVPRLIDIAARKGYSLFLLGASESSCSAAAARLMQKHPRLKIAGQYSPPYNKLLEMDHDEIAGRIDRARPDILLVCFGCPKQEKWIAMHYRTLGVPITAGVGATIDFLAGHVRRAPVWMRKSGTEWLFRLLQEPRRLAGRYGRDLMVFGTAMTLDLIQFRPGSAARNDTELTWIMGGDTLSFTLPEALDRHTTAYIAHAIGRVADCRKHILADATRVTSIDLTGIGYLSKLLRDLRQHGHELVLITPAPTLLQALENLGLRDFFNIASNTEAAHRLIAHKPREFRVRRSQRDGYALISWFGELTAANAALAWDQTERHLPAAGRVIIDLSDLSFIDSSGLGVLIRTRKHGSAGREITFRSPQPAVRNVIKLAGLEGYILNPAKQTPAATQITTVSPVTRSALTQA